MRFFASLRMTVLKSLSIKCTNVGHSGLGLWDKTPTAWHKVKVSLRAERGNLCPKTEIASSLIAPRNDSLVSSAPLFVQSFVSQSLGGPFLALPYLHQLWQMKMNLSHHFFVGDRGRPFLAVLGIYPLGNFLDGL